MSKINMDYDAAVEELKQIKSDLSEERIEKADFLKEHKLKRTEDHSNHKDKKIAKEYKHLQKNIEVLEEKRNSFQTFVKENRPKKDRTYKYDYPEGSDADDRKKYRAKMRAKAKQAGISPEEYHHNQSKYDKIISESKPAKKKTVKAIKKKGKTDKKKPLKLIKKSKDD